MSARSTVSDRPPKHPGPTGLAVPRAGGGSYVQRFKIQKERIRTLHPDPERIKRHPTAIEKLLPKISAVTREDTGLNGVRKFTRQDTVKSIKLPGVTSASAYAQAAKRRQPVPVKTFKLKLNPELSKSLSSLPSIPGSPSVDQGVSPISERQWDFTGSSFPRNTKYQEISIQKTIHGGSDPNLSVAGKDEKVKHHFESTYRNALPRRPVKHSDDKNRLTVDEPPKSNSTMSHVRTRRHSKTDSARSDMISDTRSEGNYLLRKKWKDDCDCLRCQMLRRQYKDGDDAYSGWGQYPCHVTSNIMLEDD